VADNVSIIRAVVVAIHLVNTYILLFTLTVTAWLANLPFEIHQRRNKRANILVGIGLVAAIIFSAMGAVTALGDTLFPVDEVFAKPTYDIGAVGRFLVDLRVIHPILAITTSGYLFFAVRYLLGQGLGNRVERRGKWLLIVIGIQVTAGGITVLTLAPMVMQMVHLMMADVFWISLVLFSLEIFNAPRRTS
jgi:heme A synthase